MTESKKLDPIISEFATQQEADAYDAWFRKKVQESLDDPSPSIPHEEVMAHINETIKRAAARGLAEGKQAPFATLDPIISEFATQEEADEYNAWFDREIEEALSDPRPSIPHEQVAREIDEVIRAASERQNRKAE